MQGLNFRPVGGQEQAETNKAPSRSAAEIAAKGEAEAAALASVKAAVAPSKANDERQADFVVHLTRLAHVESDPAKLGGYTTSVDELIDGDAERCVFLEEAGFDVMSASAQQLGQWLKICHRLEAKAGMLSNIPRASRNALLKETIGAEENEVAQAEQKAIEIEDKDENAEKLSADTAHAAWLKGKSVTDILDRLDEMDALIAEHPILAKEKAKLAPFAKILAITDKVAPAGSPDRQIVRAKINGLNPASLPDAAQFVRTAIFSSPTVESSVSEETQEAIARELNIPRRREIDTGSDVKAAATAMKEAPDPDNPGETKLIPMYTEDDPRNVREGVTTFTKTGDEVFLRMNLPGHPSLTMDVTGWSGEDIGELAEAMTLIRALEGFGATGLLKNIYQLDFSMLGEGEIDPTQVIEIRQAVSSMIGGFAGYDGAILDASQYRGVLQYQARILNPEGTALGTENDQRATLEAAEKLGIRRSDGAIDQDVLRAFGERARATYMTGEISYDQMRAYLRGKFPDRAPAGDDATAGMV